MNFAGDEDENHSVAEKLAALKQQLMIAEEKLAKQEEKLKDAKDMIDGKFSDSDVFVQLNVF